ncbi:hypothetical protein BC777_1112 [Yoonia maricola]|uniref:Uncharacterized protein n=1 Tax=Yoonia maricola TaxID=420999 RepID=A0A2M8WMV4_9RHOB|nr:hypothetical protein BC777_1112 [Yoonia maricola]
MHVARLDIVHLPAATSDPRVVKRHDRETYGESDCAFGCDWLRVGAAQ